MVSDFHHFNEVKYETPPKFIITITLYNTSIYYVQNIYKVLHRT